MNLHPCTEEKLAANASGFVQSSWQFFFGQLCGWSAVIMVGSAPISRSLFIVSGLLFTISWFAEGQLRSKIDILTAQVITNPVLLLTAIVITWSIFSPAPQDDIIEVLKVYSKLPMLLMLIYTLSDERWRRRAWIAFMLTMSVMLLSTYANIFFLLPWSKTQNLGIGQDHSVFIEHVSQSVMTAVTIAVVLQYAIAANSWKIRLLWLAVAVLCLGSVVFLLQGRSGLVSVAIVASVFVWIHTPKTKRIYAILAVAVLGVALFASSPLLRERLHLGYSEIVNYQPLEKTSLGARIDMWRFAASESLNHPLTGTGAGTYRQLAADYFGDCIWVCEHPHNQYLYFAIEFGIPTMLVFLWFLWCIWKMAYQSKSTYRTVLFAFLAILVIDSLYNVPMWWRGQSYFTYAMLGLLIASNLPKQISRPGQTPAIS